MRNDVFFWVVAAAAAAGFGMLVAYGATGAAVLLLSALGTVLMAGVGWAMRRQVDATWLPRWVVIGFVAKIAGAFARFYMVQYIYGAGDSLRYYQAGIQMATQWRAGIIPPLSGSGSLGTQVVESISGALFAVFTPDLLGGFVMFSMLSYLGQLGMYAAFRRWAKPHQLKPYALAVFFLPTFAFWPSSIGKDAIVIFLLGLASYFVARLVEAYELKWTIALAISLVGVGLVRIHIAGLIAIGVFGAALLAKLKPGVSPMASGRRILTLAGAVGAGILIIGLVPELLGISLSSTEDITPFTSEIVRRTSESGTVVPGGAVNSILDVPEAVALVLFRPYIFEASELQHYAAAIETTAVLLATIWFLPRMWRNRRQWRANAYLVFCSVYTLGFAIAFSVIRNLGIIARQRGQVLAFFIALVVGLGWEERPKRPDRRVSYSAGRPLDAGADPRALPTQR